MYRPYRSNLSQLGVGGNDILFKNMLLTLMKYKGVRPLNLKKVFWKMTNKDKNTVQVSRALRIM
jgi:hypothetical protein